MSRRRALHRRRGGVLLDLFVILLTSILIVAALVAGWVLWKKKGRALRVHGGFTSTVTRTLRLPTSSNTAETAPDLDISDRSAWIQARTRDLLTRRGVGEKSVVKTYTEERRENGVQWLEDTIVVRTPPRFNEKMFLAELAPVLAEKSLRLMDDRREDGRWTLSLGDGKRVYQTVIFDGVVRRSS